jgi:hypothetical protein
VYDPHVRSTPPGVAKLERRPRIVGPPSIGLPSAS